MNARFLQPQRLETTTSAPFLASVTFTVRNYTQRDRLIDEAIGQLLEEATAASLGILVTRITPWTFTVGISESVAPGTIQESDGS